MSESVSAQRKNALGSTPESFESVIGSFFRKLEAQGKKRELIQFRTRLLYFHKYFEAYMDEVKKDPYWYEKPAPSADAYTQKQLMLAPEDQRSVMKNAWRYWTDLTWEYSNYGEGK